MDAPENAMTPESFSTAKTAQAQLQGDFNEIFRLLKPATSLTELSAIAQKAVNARQSLAALDQAIRRTRDSGPGQGDDVALRFIKDRLDKTGTDLWNQSIIIKRDETEVDRQQILAAFAQGESVELARRVAS